MNHYVTVNGAVPRVTTHGGTDVAADVASLTQDIIPLHAQGERLVFEEVLAELCVPYQFVGVHGGILVSTTALLRDIRTELHVPGHVDLEVSAVIEGPGIQVGVLLNVIAGVHIVEAAVHSHFQKVVAEVETQILVDACGLGCGLVQRDILENLVHVHAAVGVIDVPPRAAV